VPPTLGNGKICYIQIPAADAQQSADFYAKTFGWTIRRRGDGELAFDDGKWGKSAGHGPRGCRLQSTRGC